MMNSLQNLFLLVRCFAYSFVRGSAQRVVGKPERICIIQIAKLGDMVCTTPMFRAVKNALPAAKVFVVGNALNKELLQGNPDVDEYILWNNDSQELVRALRTLKCDFAVTTSPNFTGLAALFLAGVPCIAVPRVTGGWTPLETRSYRLLRALAVAVPHVFDSYAPREYLKLLEPIGIISRDTQKHVHFTSEAEASALQKIRDSGIGARPFAIIAPGTGHPVKRWPPERFAAVAEYIAERYMPVAVVGAASDAEETRAMLSMSQGGDIVDFGGKLSLEELKAFIGKASLFVSGDTGPLYIAEALNVPTVDIVGPASDTAQPPKGPRNIIIAPPREKPAMTAFYTQYLDIAETKRQAQATRVEEVLAAIDELLA